MIGVHASLMQAIETPTTPTKPKTDRLGCIHDTTVGMRKYFSGEDLRYFEPNYQEKTPMFPSKCTGCMRKFTNKSKEDAANDEFSARECVYLCPKAANSHHCCLFAFCNDCRMSTLPETPRKRIRHIRHLE